METGSDTTHEFWEFLHQLIDTNPIVIDRPKSSTHPRYKDLIYPVDYGYLEGTTTVDGGGVDVWVGSLEKHRLDAVVCTIDLAKRDIELKLLLGCSIEEIQKILGFLNSNTMRAILIKP